MQLNRAGGILLHPTSLPSRYGIGDLGPEAYQFIDFLAASHIKLWQVLPLNPIGFGDSPYQAFSAFAGSPLLISPDLLAEEGLLAAKQLRSVPAFPEERVDYALCAVYKEKLCREAYRNFQAGGNREQQYLDFVESKAYWLPDFALFMALKRHFHNVPWNYWEKDIALRKPEAVASWEEKLRDEIDYQLFLQYQFFRQWLSLREYANRKGISIIGDLPIYVAYDSSDTWVNPRFFELDELGNPLKVGGVPPDYFSATGQLWGNPIYRWPEMKQDDYLWWRERIAVLLELVDVIRVDHFRGFEAYWEIPAQEKTAINGRWVKGPGEELFRVLTDYLGELPFIAEDLGVITPEVLELKKKFGFPGMKVLQFVDRESFADRPVYRQGSGYAAVVSQAREQSAQAGNYIYYTGTHDNDTLRGWYEKTILAQLSEARRKSYDQKKLEKTCWGFIDIVSQSPARWSIIPLQDFLCLDSAARMNTPNTVGGNWEWRYRKGALTPDLAQRIKTLMLKYGR
ncbi:MAG TPA: 4-alpha-glucanotransferase [Clostridia bacterium]|nr:4-alpha-glucanotransferase [Clostridia bacterium]